MMGSRPAGRVLLVGWDGADWAIARPLIAAGQLPHLARLAAAGASGELAAAQPLLTPVTWTTIATGQRADRHGVHGTLVVDPCDGVTIRPPTPADRTAAAVWEIAAAAGFRSHCVNWPATHPATARGGGVTVSDAFVTSASPDAISPAPVSAELAELRVFPDEVGVEELIPSNADAAARVLGQAILAQSATVHAVATELVEHHPWELAAVVYPGIGQASAAFMQFHPPRQSHVSPADAERYGNVVTRAYQFHDLMLGRLLELAGSGATVILVSDHGFRTGLRRQPFVAQTAEESAAIWHRPRAMFAAAGPGIAVGATVVGGSVLDVAPTVLALLGLAVARDQPGRPLSQAFDGPVEVAMVDTHDRPRPVPTATGGPDADVQHLLDLGYVDPAEAAAAAAATPSDAAAGAAAVRDMNRYHVARSLLDGGQLAAAADLLESLAAADPAHGAYPTPLLEALYGLNRWSDARRVAQRLWDGGHRVVTVIQAFARIDLGERRFDSALAHLRQAEATYAAAAEGPAGVAPIAAFLPAEMHVMFGDVYSALGQYADADRAYERAVAVDPDDEAAWTSRSRVALAVGRPGDALAHGRRAVSAGGGSAAAHFNVGIALAALGDAAGAVASYRRSLSIDGSVPAVYRRLIDLCRTDPTLCPPGLTERTQAELDELIKRRALARQGRG